jgi:hypothetical protein
LKLFWTTKYLNIGDSDVNTNGVEPERPLLPYGIPYPPTLPEKIKLYQGEHRLIDPDWRRYAKYLGARDDLWGEGFEIRSLGPTANPNFAGDWEVQYRLGPPSKDVEWDDVIAKWGLQLLGKAGFLNLDLELPDAGSDPQGRYFPKRPEAWRDEALHPVFRRDMWRAGLSDDEWYSIKPAFLLASALLDDPTTMCLFHAVATPSCYTLVPDPSLRMCIRLQVPDSLTEAEQASIFQKICDMRQWTYFYWESHEVLKQCNALALTYPTHAITARL